MAAEPTKVFIACDIKNGFGAVRRSHAIEGARRWCPMLGTVFANLWAGKHSVQPTAWASTPGGDRPITVRDGLLQGACEAPVAFALALRMAMTEFDDEMRKYEVGLTTELEYWAYVDDITIATTAELAPRVMDRLKEILERHGLELISDKCSAYCPTPGRADGVREEVTRFVKWTPDGLVVLGTASDGEYRTEITTGARRNHEPTSGRLHSARILAGKIRQMCKAYLECRRLAPAWKLVTIILNNALTFDCCVVPPEALASYAQELDEIVEALLPLLLGQDRLEHATIKRMRLPRNPGGFDATSALLRSPMAFLAQYLAIAPSVANTPEYERWKHWDSLKQPEMRGED